MKNHIFSCYERCFLKKNNRQRFFFHITAKSARIVFKIGAFLRRRLVNAWLKFKIAAWRFGVQLELSLELSLFFS